MTRSNNVITRLERLKNLAFDMSALYISGNTIKNIIHLSMNMKTSVLIIPDTSGKRILFGLRRSGFNVNRNKNQASSILTGIVKRVVLTAGKTCSANFPAGDKDFARTTCVTSHTKYANQKRICCLTEILIPEFPIKYFLINRSLRK